MPNGGSDCCATCCFNERNKGESGYAHEGSAEPSYCIIRSLDINEPHYTYCGNHPWLVPFSTENTQVPAPPIGPVYRMVDHAKGRSLWVESPDSEEIRLNLLELLSDIKDDFTQQRPYGYTLEITVIRQLKDFNERRALDDLMRIASFSPLAKDASGISQEGLINEAKQAIEQLR